MGRENKMDRYKLMDALNFINELANKSATDEEKEELKKNYDLLFDLIDAREE